MSTGIYAKDFAAVFAKLLEESGVTCYQIAQYAHINEGYLSRLKRGEKNNPSPETIVRICLALARFSDKVSLYDLNELLTSVGRTLLNKHGSN